MDWGSAKSRFLGFVSVGAAQSLDQTALRPPVIKSNRHIDVKYILHPTHVVDVRKGIRSKKTLHQSSSLTPLERECYEGKVQPYWKTDYKPIIYSCQVNYVR